MNDYKNKSPFSGLVSSSKSKGDSYMLCLEKLSLGKLSLSNPSQRMLLLKMLELGCLQLRGGVASEVVGELLSNILINKWIEFKKSILRTSRSLCRWSRLKLN